MPRVGIIALLQESNTFIQGRTELHHFEEDLLVTGDAVREKFEGVQHEVGGFLAGLDSAGIEAVPIFAARAYPFGTIVAEAFDSLVEQLLEQLSGAVSIDGLLVAPHGATVAENHPDADGYWLGEVRKAVGSDLPIIGTFDPHANLTPAMVAATNALIAYRSNPHLDQRETGKKAADLMARALNGEIQPAQAAVFPPLAINIQSQQTGELPLSDLYAVADRQLTEPGVLSNSIVLGFPYADVSEMGSSTLVVTDGDSSSAKNLASNLAEEMWKMRSVLEPAFKNVVEAVADVASSGSERITLLDMGDNVGGGSPADGTFILEEFDRQGIDSTFICLHDPESVAACESAGADTEIELRLGGKNDSDHGAPVPARCRIISFHDGKFSESKARHGGIADFDMGRTAIVETAKGITVMLTTRRVPPFSLEQLRSCGLDPADFRVFVAKGVVAPMAAYQECSDRFIHVNTPGSTCADMKQLAFHHRRKPMFPFEPETGWDRHAETQ